MKDKERDRRIEGEGGRKEGVRMMKYRDTEKLKRNQRATKVTKHGWSPQMDKKGSLNACMGGTVCGEEKKSRT